MSKVDTSSKNKMFLENIFLSPNWCIGVKKSFKDIQAKFHSDPMKNNHFIEVSKICPTRTLNVFSLMALGWHFMIIGIINLYIFYPALVSTQVRQNIPCPPSGVRLDSTLTARSMYGYLTFSVCSIYVKSQHFFNNNNNVLFLEDYIVSTNINLYA